MATIVKTPSNTWKAVIRKTGWPTTSKTFRTKRDAQDWARRTEDEMVRGVFIQRSASERTTLESALNRYLNEVSITKKPSTRQAEAKKARVLIQHLGKYSLAALSPDVIAEYRDKRLNSTTRRGDPVSNNTVRLELALLSHLYTTAIQEWGIGLASNPVSNIRKPSPGRGRDRRLAPAEERRLLSAAHQHSNPMLAWIIELALETGMRKSEITGLHRHQVNLKKRIILLQDTKNEDNRLVPLSRRATDVMKAALNNPIRPIDTDLVFFGEPGKNGRRGPYVFTKTWNELKKRIGMQDLRFHDLRHEAVSRMIEAGLSDQEVSSISGHRSMQMLRRYTHLRGENLVKRLDDLK